MPQIGIGGAEMQLHALITRSDPSVVSHQVLYYSPALDDEGHRVYRESGVPVECVPRSKARPVKFVRDLAAAIRRSRPDIVQCWLYSGAVWGRIGAMLAGARCILITHRGTGLARVALLRGLERLTSRRMHFVANSRACARVVAERLGLAPERFHVVYNGIDLKAYGPAPGDPLLRTELGIPADQKVIVMVGRLSPPKNYPMLFRVARRCQGVLPVHFVIVGHGELEAELQGQVKEMGLEGIVHFLGLRRDVPRILSGADLFCFTSLREGFPNALLEAMASGLPVVTTDFPGADELVEDGVSGMIVNREDDQAAYAAIRSLLADENLRLRLGAAAHRVAEDRFSMERMVDRTLELYRDLLSGRSSGSGVGGG